MKLPALMLAVMALAACAPSGEALSDVSVATVDAVPTEATSTESAAVETPAPVLALTAGEGAPEGLVAAVAEHWSSAAGLDVSEQVGGVPVVFVLVAVMAGRAVCGVTHSRLGEGPVSITISTAPPAELNCRDIETVLTHEVGHALCDTNAGDPSLCHSDHGAMASPSMDRGLTEETLEAVCAYAPCTAFHAD